MQYHPQTHILLQPNLGVLQIGIKIQDFVMSDSEDSTVTYTEVSSPFKDLSPLSPNYVPGPEHPPSPVYVPYVPGPVYPEFMPPEEDVLPTEEQPLPAAISPTTDSLDYPTNRDDGEEEEESFGDDRLRPHTLIPLCDEEEGLRIETTISLPSDTKDARLLATPTPPPSPLSPLSSPLPQILSPLPQILSPPLPVSPLPLPASPTYPLGYRVVMIRLRAESPSTSHPLPLPSPILLPHTRASTPPSGIPPLLPIPLSTPSPHLLLPSTDCRAGVSEVTLPPQKRLCIALGPIFEVVRVHPLPLLELLKGTPVATDMAGLSQRMTDFVTTIRKDTYEIYGRLDDAQDDRSLMSDQLNMLRRDRRAYARTTRLMKTEARLSREAKLSREA
ncbi:hypothetical protein Tco_1081555 [Tanacetum coccineum]|uniref:Uncharacterized protein n=1 Tax=Tanacetum coccineum TaxID=301880 RepID=A0ABQ5HXX0_9ASTR